MAAESVEPPDGADIVPLEAPRRDWYHGNPSTPRWATESEWLAKYARALPLLMYLIRHVDWHTGQLCGYRHAAAAQYLQCTRSTVAQQFRLLRESGKLTILARRQYDLDLQLACGGPEYQKITTLAEYQKTDTQESATLGAPEYQKIAARVAKKPHPVLYGTFHTQIQTEANASADAASAPPLVSVDPPKPPEAKQEQPSLLIDSVTTGNLDSGGTKKPRPSRPRKLTDAQREAHNERQAYISQLIQALKDVIGFKGLLPYEKTGLRRDAEYFLTAGPDGGRAAVTDITECYRVVKASDFWHSRPVGMAKLAEFYPEWLRDQTAFRAAHAPRENGKHTAGGNSNGATGHAGHAPAPSTGPTLEQRQAARDAAAPVRALRARLDAEAAAREAGR